MCSNAKFNVSLSSAHSTSSFSFSRNSWMKAAAFWKSETSEGSHVMKKDEDENYYKEEDDHHCDHDHVMIKTTLIMPTWRLMTTATTKIIQITDFFNSFDFEVNIRPFKQALDLVLSYFNYIQLLSQLLQQLLLLLQLLLQLVLQL